MKNKSKTAQASSVQRMVRRPDLAAHLHQRKLDLEARLRGVKKLIKIVPADDGDILKALSNY